MVASEALDDGLKASEDGPTFLHVDYVCLFSLNESFFFRAFLPILLPFQIYMLRLGDDLGGVLQTPPAMTQ